MSQSASNAGGELRLSAIGQISVTAHDLDRAVAFYRDTLGMTFLFQVPKMAFFDAGGVRLMLGVPEDPRFDHPASILYYRVDDIQAACAALETRGVALESGPHLTHRAEDHELWLAFFPDSEGNLLGLMCERPV